MMPLKGDDGSERSSKKKNTAPWWFEKQKMKIEIDGNDRIPHGHKEQIHMFHKSMDLLTRENIEKYIHIYNS